ncbi:MAG: hypothetical protein UF228_07195 [Lachnospiraceae bacterium]|nr:hypothetical protein [Lachnospiraceae bacterium]
MTRKEQMYKDWKENISNSYDTEIDDTCFSAFLDGAKWADANPQFSKEKFIEKACWWLRETAHFYVSDFTGELDDNGLLEDFKKAMEE